ncbi:ABC transporter substrate-binding protein [Marinilactibacillus sp. GCM10026970]|uniref:ABC transporter substrate-binding protein n=1 Tax=Marinilactibacillus sp. GCM10026970 TaxID=3252642 RepID=UPI00360B962B
MKALTLKSSVMLSSLFLLAACGNGNSNGEGASGSADGEDEVLTLEMFSSDMSQDDPFDNAVAQEILEKTGVKLEFSYPVGGDDQEAVALMIASGDYPDLIYGKGGLNQLIDAGGVIPLEDMIEEKGDNIKALYGDQLDRLRRSSDDPSIYHVGTAGVENMYLETSGTMRLQLEVLKELGYPEINTLEDYENALTEYMEMHPTNEDGEPWIPLSLSGSDWRWLITVGDPASAVGGIEGDGQWYVADDGEATYKFQRPELKEYFQWLNGMNAKGMLDEESFTHTNDTYVSKLSSGRVLGIADQDWNFTEAEAALRADEDEWSLWAPLPVGLDEDTEVQTLKDYGFTGMTGVSITSSTEHQEEAFEFLDWFATEEAQILMNWGVEGVHYEIVDGKRVQLEEDRKESQTNPNYSLESGIGAYIHPFPQWGSAALDSNGQTIGRMGAEDIIAQYSEPEKEALEGYGIDLWVDLFPATEDLETPKHGRAWEIALPTGSNVNVIQQRADDYTTQKITEAILADPADFNGIWEEMQAELESIGIEEANAEMTEIIRDRLELWGETE